jgi:hypothetical protein
MADRHNRDIDRPRAPLPEPLPAATIDAHAHLEIVTNTAADSATGNAGRPRTVSVNCRNRRYTSAGRGRLVTLKFPYTSN